MAEFILLIDKGEISSSAADVVLAERQLTGADPDHIIKEKDLRQVSSPQKLGTIVAQIIEQNPKAVSDLNKGKEESLKFLLGQIMRETKGKANPQVAERLLRETLW